MPGGCPGFNNILVIMAWKTETLIVGEKEVKGVQVREDRPYSLVRLDPTRMSAAEQRAVTEYFAPGTQKQWGEGRYTLLRVQSTLLRHPEIREQLDAAPEPVVETSDQEFVYEGEIAGKQLPYLRRWAAERGARVEEYNPMTTQQGTTWKYRIISRGDLLERQRIQRGIEQELFKPTKMQEAVGGFTQTDRLITRVPSVESITRQEREAFVQKAAKERVETEGPAARIRTLLSPQGYEYIGAVALGKDPTVIVQRKIEQETRMQMVDQETTDKYMRSVVETVSSPPFEVTTAFAAGVGFARLGATRIGARVLSTTAAKTALAAGAVSYTGLSGIEAYTDISAGKVERGVGRIIVTGASLGAGFAGAKLGAREFAKAPAEIKADIKPSRTKGASISTPQTGTEPGRTAGVFETRIQVGKKEVPVKGVILGTSEQAGKGRAVQKIKILIPEQKVGKITIKETTMLRAGTVVKTGKGAYTVRTSEGVIIDASAGKIDLVLAGSRRGTAYYIERAEAQGGKVKFYTGSGFETAGKVEPKDIEVATKLIAGGSPAARVGEVPRADVKMSGIQNIEWVDITKLPAPAASKPLVKGWPGAVYSKTKGPAPSLKAAELPKPVAPSGKVSAAGTRETLGLPTFTATASVASAAAGLVVKPARELKSKPVAMKIKAVQETAGFKSLPAMKIVSGQASERLAGKVDISFYSRQISEPGLDIGLSSSRVQASALKQAMPEALKTKTAFAPAVPAAPPVIPPVVTPPLLLGIPGGILLRSGYAAKARYKARTVINPVPVALDIKLPKIAGV